MINDARMKSIQAKSKEAPAVRNVQSLQIAWRILDALTNSSGSLELQDIVRITHIPVEKVRGYLKGFRKLGLAVPERTNRWQLGPFALELGLLRLGKAQPVDVAAEVIIPVAKRFRVGAVITVWGTYGPTIAKTEDFSRAIFGTGLKIGNVHNLTDSMSDRFWTAFLPSKVIEHRFEMEFRETSRDLPSASRKAKLALADLQDELAEIRRRGVRSLHRTTVGNLRYLTAPVIDYTGQIELVISFSGPIAATDALQGDQAAQALLACTWEISQRLGYLESGAEDVDGNASTVLDDRDDPSASRVMRGRGTQSVEIAGGLLETLASSMEPMMLSSLAETAGLAPGRAHPYLVSLKELGMVEQDAAGLYALGWKALQLGVARLRGSETYRLTESLALKLAASLDLSVIITVWGREGPTLVRSQDSSYPTTFTARLGHVFGLTSFVGKLWAAYLPARMSEKMIAAELKAPEARGGTVQDTLGKMEKEFSEIARTGIAISQETIAPGTNALSVPIFGARGEIEFAVTLLGPAAALDCSLKGPQATALMAMGKSVNQKIALTTQRSRVD